MLIEKVRKTIKDNNLIKNGEHIVAGLSGGPDSVCLFHVLLSLCKEMDLHIYPVHINHKFRPGAAEHDQAYVEELCRSFGLECRVFTEDCHALAERSGMTDEEAGRKVRYDSFRKVAEEIVASGAAPEHVKIAVAQNANDQAETILFRLMRGTGPDGLAGISYSRSEGPFTVIRPLLDTYRSEIEEYCSLSGLEPVTDHTNSQTVYSRNKIRLQLLPYIQKEYNTNIMAALTRLGRIAGEDKDYIWQQVEKAYQDALVSADGCETVLDLEKIRRLHKAIRHRVLMHALDHAGLSQDVTQERLAAADQLIDSRDHGGTKIIQLPYGYEIKLSYGKIICGRNILSGSQRISRPQAGAPQQADIIRGRPGEEPPHLDITLTDDPQQIKAAAESFSRKKSHGGYAVFDADKLADDPDALTAEITVRHRREGDYIQLSSGRKKIKKLMIDMKIPSDRRSGIWLAARGSEVLYMAGDTAGENTSGSRQIRSRYAECYRPEGSTKRLLILKFV